MGNMRRDAAWWRGTFGGRVRTVRRRLGMTQGDLATALQDVGVLMSQSTIAKLENGIRPTPIDEAAAIAQALGVPIQQLLEGDVVPVDEMQQSLAQLEAQLEAARAELLALQLQEQQLDMQAAVVRMERVQATEDAERLMELYRLQEEALRSVQGGSDGQHPQAT